MGPVIALARGTGQSQSMLRPQTRSRNDPLIQLTALFRHRQPRRSLCRPPSPHRLSSSPRPRSRPPRPSRSRPRPTRLPNRLSSSRPPTGKKSSSNSSRKVPPTRRPNSSSRVPNSLPLRPRRRPRLRRALLPAVPLASFAGSLGAVGVVYALARLRRRGLSTGVLLLAGVTLNSLFSAVIMFVQYLADYTQSFQVIRYLMGNLDVSSYTPILWATPLLVVAAVAFAWLPRSLNLLALGDDSAAARGVNVLRVQRVAFLSASLATGAAVSLGGPIGFVGIIIPHVVRLLVGADHRIVLPASTLLGAAFLVACDVAARTIMSPMELPVGIITAMLGGPFFLWLLARKR